MKRKPKINPEQATAAAILRAFRLSTVLSAKYPNMKRLASVVAGNAGRKLEATK